MTFPVIELGAAAGGVYEAEDHGLLNTSTAAGWATVFALVGFVSVAFVLGRGQGFIKGVGAALGFGLVWAGTGMWVNYLVRSWSLNNPDSLLAGGLAIDI